jgi:hypothetical protein
MWQAIIFGFLAGVMGGNGFPHFARASPNADTPAGSATDAPG